MNLPLNVNNFLFYAIKYYNNPRCNGLKDLKEDLYLFKTTKKHLKKYLLTGEINERVLLNNIIIMHNVWGEFASTMLFYRIPKENWNAVKSTLEFLSFMPEYVYDKKLICSSTIDIDENLTKKFNSL